MKFSLHTRKNSEHFNYSKNSNELIRRALSLFREAWSQIKTVGKHESYDKYKQRGSNRIKQSHYLSSTWTSLVPESKVGLSRQWNNLMWKA